MCITNKPPLINTIFILAPYTEAPLLLRWPFRIIKNLYRNNHKHKPSVLPGSIAVPGSDSGLTSDTGRQARCGSGSEESTTGQFSSFKMLFRMQFRRARENGIAPAPVLEAHHEDRDVMNANISDDQQPWRRVGSEFSIDVQNSHHQYSSIRLDSFAEVDSRAFREMTDVNNDCDDEEVRGVAFGHAKIVTVDIAAMQVLDANA